MCAPAIGRWRRLPVNHRVSSTEECSILLVENKSTAHLGDTASELTRSIEEQLEE